MPFFNCSTSLFAYIIYFGGEKIGKKKFLDGVTLHHLYTLSGGGGYAFNCYYIVENQQKHSIFTLYYMYNIK